MFKLQPNEGIFECTIWLNGSTFPPLFFLGDDRGFLKEEVKTYRITAPMSPVNLLIFFSHCRICSLWLHEPFLRLGIPTFLYTLRRDESVS